MRVIGLLGGMSWESSIAYERIINEEVRRRLGGTASADLIIRSYNFAAIEALQEAGEWGRAGAILAADAKALERSGAELIVLCTNTMHVVAPAIESATSIPFLHIADATAAAITRERVGVVALLGTRYTMEQPFYRDRIESFGVTVVVPDPDDRDLIHDVIFGELVRGVVRPESRDAFLAVIGRLIDEGAEGVIAGCTEIELLVRAGDVPVPYFPSTAIHALAAVDFALS